MKTVLVVDDEFGITDALGDLLTDEGFQVTLARNGWEALAFVAESRPDLILLDYMMPMMDGCQVLRELQADPKLASTPVILMSAVQGASLPADCHPAAFLSKPFSIEVLLELIARLLAPAG